MADLSPPVPDADDLGASSGNDRTPDEAPRKPPLLDELVGRYKLPAGLFATAVALAPNLVDVPFIDRYEVWGAVAIFVIAVVVAFVTHSRAALVSVVAAAIVGFGVVELVARLPNKSGKPDAHGEIVPPRPPPPRPTRTLVGSDPIATLRAFGKRWVLDSDGSIDGFSDDGTPEVRYGVKGPASAMIACGDALVVTHEHGRVARVSPTSGTLLSDYRYGWQGGDVACSEDYIWTNKIERGSVVQLASHSLRLVEEYPVVSEATSLTYGDGTIWVLDGPGRTVVGVDARTKEKIGPFAVMQDAEQILFVDGYLWLMHRKQSCLMRLDIARGVEIGPGVPLGRFPWRMRERDGVIYVADFVENSILEVDADSSRPLGNPIVLGERGRLKDADEYAGRIVGIDAAGNQMVILAPAAKQAHRSKHRYTATAGCPRH